MFAVAKHLRLDCLFVCFLFSILFKRRLRDCVFWDACVYLWSFSIEISELSSLNLQLNLMKQNF